MTSPNGRAPAGNRGGAAGDVVGTTPQVYTSAANRRILRALQLNWDGWPVIPLGGADMKHPLVKWTPFQDRLPTDDEVASWPWDRATGLALVIGKALWESRDDRWRGLWVLDVEAEHRAEAEAWLDSNVLNWRAGKVAESGSNGLHVYFRASGPVSTDHDFRWGDVQGENALAILPPSKHRSGGVYRWQSEGEVMRLEPQVLPGYKANRPPLRDVLAEPLAEGNRNTTLFRLGSQLRGDGLDAGVIEAALQSVNAERCSPPLDCDEVRDIALSAARYDANPTVIITPNGSKVAPPPIGSLGGGEVELVEFSGTELVDRARNEPALEYLPFLDLDGYLVKGWSHLLAGYPRVGKTELLTRLVREWLRRGYSVLYITEESAAMWANRLAALDADWGNLQVLIGLGVPPAILYERAFTGSEQIIIADTFRNLLGLRDETDNSEIARAVNPWVSKARETDKTLIFGHHDRKGGGKHGEAIAGGHALLAAFDIALEVVHDQQAERRRIVKGYPRLITIPELVYEMNDAGELVPLGDPAALRFDDVKERVFEVLTDEWESTKAILEALAEPRPGREQVRRALVDLAKEDSIERDPPITESGKGKTHQWRLKGVEVSPPPKGSMGGTGVEEAAE